MKNYQKQFQSKNDALQSKYLQIIEKFKNKHSDDLTSEENEEKDTPQHSKRSENDNSIPNINGLGLNAQINEVF